MRAARRGAGKPETASSDAALFTPDQQTGHDAAPEEPGAVYLAPRGFETALAEELRLAGKTIVFQRGRLFGTAEPPFEAVWVDNIWQQPRLFSIRSIADGARRLQSVQRNWALFSTNEHRRAHLIEEALPKVSARPLVFGEAAPEAPLGSWTLWSRDRILASARCSSPFVHGQARFAEDRVGPPNRAYLKLWEVFTRLGRKPAPGDLCLDLGGSPGGWSWVLANLGARVFSVDKASLAPHVARHPLVEYCPGSAFAVDPVFAGDISWLFCDVACYPDRLYSFIERWITGGSRANFVCTIKFSGCTDFIALHKFMRIPESVAMHLFANKHEITWIRLVK